MVSRKRKKKEIHDKPMKFENLNDWINSSSRFVSSLGLSNMRAGSIVQGLDSHAWRTAQNFPKIILGKGTFSPIKYDLPDFF